MILFIIVET